GLQQGHGGIAEAQGHGGARRYLAARCRHHAGCQRKPGGVFTFVGPHAAGDHPLHPVWTLARPRPRARQSRSVCRHAEARQGHATGVVEKKILSAASIRVPDGELARAPDDAVAVAKRVGYPVALKAQAAALPHKTEAGGVMLDLVDEGALRAAW